MDPITRASRAFLAEANAFWHAGKGPVLPMIAEATARAELVKTLRLAELDLANRRPLFLHEEPFVDARSWGEAIAAAIAEDYEAVREGAEKEGVPLPPFPPATEGPTEKAPPLASAVWAMEQAAAPLGKHLDGVLVAFVPKAVGDPAAYRHAVATLAATRFTARVRLAVHAPPDGPLADLFGGEGAHFEVDQDGLAKHLEQLGAGAESAGPPGPPPPEPTEEQRRAHEEKTGSKLPAPATGRTLREMLVAAAMATGRQEHRAAAKQYTAARELCQREGLALEQAGVLVALGGACLAAGEVNLAGDAYRRAGEMAEKLEAWALACQARLGAGGAHLAAKRYEAAALAYEGAAGAAERAETPVLGVEALRMAGTCHLLRGAQSETVRTWLRAVDLGGAIPAAERPETTFPKVAEDLAAILERRGLTAQAAHVRSLVAGEPAAQTDRDAVVPRVDEPRAVPPGSPPHAEKTAPSTEPTVPLPVVKRAPAALSGTSMGFLAPKGPALPFAPAGASPSSSAPTPNLPREAEGGGAPPAPAGPAVKRPPAALSGASVGFILPKGPAVPFSPAKVSEVGDATTEARGTVPMPADAPRRPTLPFELPRAAAAAAPGPTTPVVKKPSSLAGTASFEMSAELMAKIAQHGALPFARPAAPPPATVSPHGPAPSPVLTLERHAALCAELAAFPAQQEAIFQRHGLADTQKRTAEDGAWKARLQRDPGEHEMWERLYREHYARLVGTSRQDK